MYLLYIEKCFFNAFLKLGGELKLERKLWGFNGETKKRRRGVGGMGGRSGAR